jgi:hypothetical protein
MKTITVKFYQDPGHGWIAVKRNLLHDLNIQSKITPYSYQKGQTVYLEEDCDAYLFVKEMKNRGIEVIPEYKTTNNSSPIRSYQSYCAA